jgi:hypothetical protein
MLDILMIALGLGFFALSVGYTVVIVPEETSMFFNYSLAALVTAGIMMYLSTLCASRRSDGRPRCNRGGLRRSVI